MLIEQAARDAIRKGAHSRNELYLDEDFFRSLQFKDHRFRESVPSAPYKQKMTSSIGSYYHLQSDDLVAALKPVASAPFTETQTPPSSRRPDERPPRSEP